ncbi:putative IQ motif, EF-hand binding, TIR domain, PH domain-containing protein [Lupinus albus]|uniref:Putative IQ motif, EF-hand binding, TIR domain, PH domain-containing protein n=1 Tax=Lupinus albus TaxID=3870 RepID=A0A6A4P091_LUPAL|nr:putative IQ motif, EF-hand binding, TIR domain, PH domain-containing protein [Lupinus albus]
MLRPISYNNWLCYLLLLLLLLLYLYLSSMNGSVYDVFISFRGIDTRSGFTGNLHRALCGKQIKSFMDDKDLEKGAEINPALHKAIQNSRIALVVLSKNYASSTFCLDELEKIMDCSKDKGMLVLPVFYEVDPSDVRYQKGEYADALNKHEARIIDNKDKIEKWRFALTKIAHLSGWEFNRDRYEYELIDSIVEDIIRKIDRLSDGEKEKIICNVDDKHVTQDDNVEYLVTYPTPKKALVEQFNDMSIAGILNYDSRKMMAAAALIQHRFRTWRFRRELTHKRCQAIKIQAAFRGYQVRKQNHKIIWSVGVLEKAILRWRLKRRGLCGFKVNHVQEIKDVKHGNETEEEFFRAGRKQAEERVERYVACVKAMFSSKKAQEEYRRMKLAHSQAKLELEEILNSEADKLTKDATQNKRWEGQGQGLFVCREENNETLLLHHITSDDIYTKQEDTVISWRDPEYATELALRFQDPSECSYIWEHICSVQRNI